MRVCCCAALFEKSLSGRDDRESSATDEHTHELDDRTWARPEVYGYQICHGSEKISLKTSKMLFITLRPPIRDEA